MIPENRYPEIRRRVVSDLENIDLATQNILARIVLKSMKQSIAVHSPSNEK